MCAGSSSRVYSCGLNSYGQLGLGHVENVTVPEEVEGLTGKGVVSVVGGSQHCVALTRAGEVFAFGRGDSGQLGLSAGAEDRHAHLPVGASAFHPVQIDPARFGGAAAVQVTANGTSSGCVTAGGTLYTWGFGESGQLGNNGAGDENFPFQVNNRGAEGKGAGDLKKILVRSAGLGGQHLVVLGGPRPGEPALPSSGDEYAVVEDPEAEEGDDDEGGDGEEEDEDGDGAMAGGKDDDEDEEDDDEDGEEDEKEEDEEGASKGGKRARKA